MTEFTSQETTAPLIKWAEPVAFALILLRLERGGSENRNRDTAGSEDQPISLRGGRTIITGARRSSIEKRTDV